MKCTDDIVKRFSTEDQIKNDQRNDRVVVKLVPHRHMVRHIEQKMLTNI